MADILNQIVTSENELVKLLGNYNESFVGYVYGMRFDEVLILTNDNWKHLVNGIPHNSFLVSAGFNPERMADAAIIDKEVVLLRVLEPVNLPQDNDFIRTRIEHHQRRTSNEKLPGDVNDGMDPMTASELQAGGLRCSILGTFYIENGQLRLGSDIENFMTLSRMRAYKPSGDALAMIVNHINPEVQTKAIEEAHKAGFKKIPSPIEIGTVRYTSTARMHRGPNTPLVKVLIQPTDFLSRRTAVLGMTRTGKSNTVKTTVSAVALAALTDNIPVGQLIFDINGEYANANAQDDGSSIADVFENTVCYRAIDTPEKPNFKDLRINFYDQPDVALGLLEQLSRETRGNAQDITTFITSSLDEPDRSERGDHNRWQVRKAVFHCIIYSSQYQAPANFRIDFPVSGQVVALVQPELPAGFPSTITRGNQPFYQLTLDQAKIWFLAARRINRSSPLPSSGGGGWVDSSLQAYLNVLANESSGGTYIRGYRQLQEYVEYHSSTRHGDVVQEILNFLYSGRIVILDLSAGPVSIRKTLSERVAVAVFNRQFDDLNHGKQPMNVVLYVEEAHNLIGKSAALTDTWPRIAKEGAKARIAFVYATQEPSSVHPNILANTENWFVTHLNNDDELKTLGKFYDFSDFIASLKAAQDVGFARIKTLSSPFVIPTQINRFTPSEIIAAVAKIKNNTEEVKNAI
ncbi:ATP-binding protein [Ferruginibacter sp.]